jgi:hypothetical protein
MRLLLLLPLFILSCSGESVPKDIFPPKKMGAVLYDIVLADEWMDFTRMKDSSYFQLSKRATVYDSIFQLHSITKADYQKSIEYYQGRPDLLKTILDSVKTKSDTASRKRVKIKITEKL